LDLDQLAANHHRHFGIETPPYESFFLSPDRLLGGSRTDAVQSAYRAGGFNPNVADTSADHIGIELAYLGWLQGARSDAVQDDQLAVASRIARLESRFLEEHLLRWLPVLVAAIPQSDTFFARCLELALGLSREHASTLGVRPSEWSLPPVPDLEDPKTGLRELAEALCTPCLAGGLLTHSAIAKLGRDRRLPRGFGDRPQTLTNLFRSAARFQQLDQVLGSLDDHLAGWARAYDHDVSTGPWQARIVDCRARIDRMRRMANAQVVGL
jgi:hypothetical protein